MKTAEAILQKIYVETFEEPWEDLENEFPDQIKAALKAMEIFASQSKEDISCHCRDEDKHGTTTVECCNRCGKSVEPNWKVGPIEEESPRWHVASLIKKYNDLKKEILEEAKLYMADDLIMKIQGCRLMDIELVIKDLEALPPPSDSPRWVKASERLPNKKQVAAKYGKHYGELIEENGYYSFDAKGTHVTVRRNSPALQDIEWLDESKSAGVREDEGLHYFREGYKYLRSFNTKIPYDEMTEITVLKAFSELIKSPLPPPPETEKK